MGSSEAACWGCEVTAVAVRAVLVAATLLAIDSVSDAMRFAVALIISTLLLAALYSYSKATQ